MGEARRALNVGVLGAQPIASALWYRRGMHSCMAMTLRLNHEQTAALRAAAEQDGLSMQAAAVQAVEEDAYRRREQRDALVTQFVRENRTVLDRLKDS